MAGKKFPLHGIATDADEPGQKWHHPCLISEQEETIMKIDPNMVNRFRDGQDIRRQADERY